MKLRTLIAALVGVVLSAPSVADDRGSFYQYAQTPAGPQFSAGVPLVWAGSAPIDRALGAIIPAPYRILLDSSVPPSVALVWRSGDNWMEVLNGALTPIGLMAKPDWAANSVTVTWRPEPVAQPAAPQRSEAQPRKTERFQPKIAVEMEKVSGGFEVEQEEQPSRPRQQFIGAISDSARDTLRVSADEQVVARGRTITLDRYGTPKPEQMWEIIQKAVDGWTVTVAGFSGAPYEQARIRWANTYARAMKAKFDALGFPAGTVVVMDRTEYKQTGDARRVEISFSRRAM